jgi:YegS/Rv2252/BmrU family lipid kinase
MRERLPLIVINPAAGGGAAGRAWASAAPTVRSHFGPYECAFTRHRGDATRIAEEESRAGRRFIITFGGDGTISEVARGILRSGGSVELGFLPQGTGADFLRTLGAPSRLADAARALRHSRTCTIDVGKISYTTGDNETTSTWFVNSASFGLSGEVAERTNEAQRASKALGGKVAYAAQTLKAALAFTPKAVWIQTGTESARRLTITQVSIANGRFFGGGMKIAPNARLVDGRLDLTVVRKLSFLRILADGPRLYTGTHLSLPEVDHCQVDSVKAWPDTTEEEVGLELDGETPGRLPAHFEVCPRALTVRVPQ